MPELPEVETSLRGIFPHIKQQMITKVIIRQSQLRWPIQADIQEILVGKKIRDAERRGKYILLKTENGIIIIHLGMSGHLRILSQDSPHNKHDRLDILFNNKKILRFNDPRRFGAFLWTSEDPYKHPLLKNLGIEPLTKNFTGKYLWLRAQGRSVAIKVFIMNSCIVTGIGNIYANEALFAAGIHPTVPAQSISVARLQILVKAIKRILREAIKRGGTTLNDFISSEGKPGYFSNQLKVYGRAGMPCVICHRPLQFMQLGQRSTVYCKHCQY